MRDLETEVIDGNELASARRVRLDHVADVYFASHGAIPPSSDEKGKRVGEPGRSGLRVATSATGRWVAIKAVAKVATRAVASTAGQHHDDHQQDHDDHDDPGHSQPGWDAVLFGRSHDQSLRYIVSLSRHRVPEIHRVYWRGAEAMERHDRGAPPRGARGDPGDHLGAGDRTRAVVREDVGGCREGRHRTGDPVQVLPRRRSDPRGLAPPADPPPPCPSRRSSRPDQRSRQATPRRPGGLRPHLQAASPAPSTRAPRPLARDPPASERRGGAGAATTPPPDPRAAGRSRTCRRHPPRHHTRRARQLLPARPHGSQLPPLQRCNPSTRNGYSRRPTPLTDLTGDAVALGLANDWSVPPSVAP